MSKYILHKAENYIEVPALLELSEGCEHVTFMEILRSPYGDYEKIALRIPEDLRPEVYEGTYGHIFLRADGMMEPGIRLPIYTARGKRYAYYDNYERDEDDPRNYDSYKGKYLGRGRLVRYRLEIIES